MIVIRTMGVEASIEGYSWYCQDRDVEAMLRATLDPDGPSGSDPNPDATAIKNLKKILPDLTVVSQTPLVKEPLYPPIAARLY